MNASTNMMSALSSHDWSILSNSWARGLDYVVFKGQKKNCWTVHYLAGMGTFTTRKAAYEIFSDALIAESHRRSFGA
jgi:hypothetical protein